MESEDSASSAESEEYDIDFKPKYFLRCHSKQRKDAADVQTQVWQCSFEPTASSKSSKIVATCGGNTVCFIDVETGQLNKKYYSSNSRENFLALAWTTIDGHKILAAGGSVQMVNFILYDEGFCFHEEKFDRSVMNAKCGITSLLFHPKEGNILYCSCSDGKILILKMGDLSPPNFFTDVQLLHRYQVACEVFLLIYYQPWDILLGTSDNGIYCWNGAPEDIIKGAANPTTPCASFPLPQQDFSSNIDIMNSSALLQFLGRPLALTESPSLVDTAEILENGLVASKCALHGAIYIWNLEEVLGEGKVSEGDRNIRISPLYQLKWSDTDNYFMYLGYDKESKWLSCGDDRGAIWLYDIRKLVTGGGKNEKNKKNDMIEPTVVLEWPNLHDQYSSRKRKLNLDVYDIVINKTILSHNSRHLVAVTNNNMVCIWKRKK